MHNKQPSKTTDIAEREMRFRQLAESVNTVFWLVSIQPHEMLYISPGYERIWGRSCASLIESPSSWLDAIIPEDRECVLAVVTEQRLPADLEYRIRRPDGELRWIHDRAYPVYDESGKVFRIAGVAEDITDRKTMVCALAESKQMLAAICETQSNFIVEADRTTIFGGLLKTIIDQTSSAYGLVAEVLHDTEGAPYLKEYAIANLVWDESALDLYKQFGAQGLELHNLNNLYGAVISSGQAVIANDPKHDPRAGGLPAGHPSMHSFLGLPLYCGDEIVGIIGLANRPGGYEETLHQKLEPLLTTCASLVAAYRNFIARKSAEGSLMLAKTAIEKSKIPFFWLSMEGKVIDANDYACRSLGYTHEELLGKNLADFAPDYTPEGGHQTFKMLKKDGVRILEGRHRHKDGTVFPVEVTINLVSFDGKDYKFAFVQDITERQNAEEQLRIAATVFESAEAMIVTGPDGNIIKVNEAFTKITGYAPEEVVGRNPRMMQSGRHSNEFYQKMWRKIERDGFWQGEIWDKRKTGEIYPKWLSISSVKGNDGKVSHYVGSFTDITEHKEAQDRIVNLAFYDQLTGLPNRRLVLERIQHAMAVSSRKELFGALLFIDVDNFKVINDTLGHDSGDLLLKELAQCLLATVRKEDTVARIGGDEFVIVLEEIGPHQEQAAAYAKVVGDKLLAELSKPFQLNGREYLTSVSMGITLYRSRNDDVQELLKRADMAMYESKKAGRNTLRFFDPAMQAAIEIRVRTETDLRSALKMNQFLAYYQKRVDKLGNVKGAETLLRWQHPERGMITPLEFIPLAEESGLIVAIGQWVLEQACRQLTSWEEREKTKGLLLSVNISARELKDQNFVTRVKQVLDKTGANAAQLELEITESMLMDDMECIVQTMESLRDLGVSFSLDDFGTGYSSLSYLKRLPINRLKIDRSFVKDLGVDKSDEAIVQTIIRMGQTLGLEIIAEGVETEQQRDFLDQQGCQHYQGYLFGEPVSIDIFEQDLK